MPIRLGASGRPQFGIGSALVFADRTAIDAAGDITDIADFHQRTYNFTSAEIAGNAPGIQIPIIGDTPDEFPYQQGPLNIQNGFTMPAYTQHLGPLFRQLMNDNRALDPTHTTLGAGIGAREAANGSMAATLALTANTAIEGSPPSGLSNPDATLAPIRVQFTPSASSAAKVTLTGTDYHNNTISETVDFNNSADAKVTTYFFKTFTRIISDTDVTVAVAGSDTESDRRYVSIFANNDENQLLPGMDVYSRKGNVPNMYREVNVDGLSFNFSYEGSVEYTWACIGKRPQTNLAPDGSSTQPTLPTRILREAFTGWQCGIFYRNVGLSAEARLEGIDASFNLANNMGYVPTLTGIRTPGQVFRNRQNVTIEGTMTYRAEDSDLIQDVLNNEFLEDTRLELVNATTGGFPKTTRYEFGRLQFTNLPDAPVGDEGYIRRPMSLMAVPSEDGTTPALRIVTHELDPLPLTAISF